MPDFVSVRHEPGGVALVTFERAESMNSIDPHVMRHLRAQFNLLLADDKVRAIVLTGKGKAFCAGADVKAFEAALKDHSTVQWVLDTTSHLHPLLLELRGSGKPFIAAMNGVAAGGGLGLALAADVRIGNPQARFAAGYFGLGLSPDGGSTWLMPRIIGEQRTRRFFLTNQVMDANEAVKTGLLDELVAADQLIPRALELAAQWGVWARMSRESTKRLLEAQSSNNFQEQLDLERGLIAAAAGTKDFAEGVAAFLQKRKPKFE